MGTVTVNADEPDEPPVTVEQYRERHGSVVRQLGDVFRQHLADRQQM